MVSAGIPGETIKSAQKRRSSNWDIIKDPDDRRKTLIGYEALSAEHKRLIENEFGNPYQYTAAEVVKPLIKADSEDIKSIRYWTDGQDRLLPAPYQQLYIRACAYLKAACARPSEVKRTGLPDKATFKSALIALLKAENKALKAQGLPKMLPENERRFTAKVAEYKDKGPTCVISGKWSNNNSEKLTEKCKKFLKATYGNDKKPSIELTTILLNESRSNRGLDTVTTDCVKVYLHRPEVEIVWYLPRHGMKAWKDRFRFSLSKMAPSCANAKWESDGSKLNLFYQDGAGKIRADLTVYVVMDVYSQVILGWHISHTEKQVDVYAAYKMALQFSQKMPVQLLYDGGGGNKGADMQRFFARMSHINFKAEPRNGQSKLIESVIKYTQTQVLSTYDAFTGQNVGDTVSKNSKLNPDKISRLNKQGLLKDKEATIKMWADAVTAWNYGLNKAGEVRMAKYKHSENPLSEPVEYLDMVELFWLEQGPITYRGEGIKPIIAGESALYVVYDDNQVPDLDFLEKNIQRQFMVKYDPDNLDRVMLYDLEERYIATADSKTYHASAHQDYTAGSRAAIDAELKVRKQQEARIRSQHEDAVSEYTAEEAVMLSFQHIHKDALNRAEGDFILQQTTGSGNGIAPSRPNKAVKDINIMLDDDFEEGINSN